MYSKTRLVLLLLALASGLFVATGWAQVEKGKDAPKPIDKESAKKYEEATQLVDKLALASALIRQGRDKHDPDPLALLLAAKLVHEVGQIREPKIESAAGAKAPEVQKYETPQELIDEAKKMASGNAAVAELVKQTEKRTAERSRGRIPFPMGGVVNFQGGFVVHSHYALGLPARVHYMAMDPTAYLSVKVFDASNQLVAQNSGNAFSVDWMVPPFSNPNNPPGTPANTNAYRIQIDTLTPPPYQLRFQTN
jgi:hypothetical protein